MARHRGEAFQRELNRSWDYYLEWHYSRVEDPAGGVGAKRPADYLALLPSGVALLAEAKSTVKSALPERNIKPHQIEALLMAERLGHRAYLLINFRDYPRINLAFAVGISDAIGMLRDLGRKSIPLKWCQEHAIALPRVSLEIETGEGKIQKQKAWDLRPLLDVCLHGPIVEAL
jgi:Holliday junction resolvase